MNLSECTRVIKSMFNPEAIKPDELGVMGDPGKTITRIGYATNLTPETIALAEEQGIDLIITHHGVWDFMYDMKPYCTAALEKSGIAHIYAHLPLDAADFGTAVAFATVLKAKVIERFGKYEGFEACVVAQCDDVEAFRLHESHIERAT